MPQLLLSLLTLLVLASLGRAAPPPPVTAIAYDSQGKLIAVASTTEVRVFETTRGETQLKLSSESLRISAVAFSPDSHILAVALGEPGKSGSIRFYSVTPSDESANPIATVTAHTDTIYTIAFAPDGKSFASAGYDRSIRVFTSDRLSEGRIEPRHVLKDHSDAIYALSFHPDSQLLASGAADRTVKVWDVASGQRLYTLSDPTDWVYSVAWSPDKKHLAAAGVDRSIRIWAADRMGGKLVRSAFAHTSPIWRIAYSTDGRTLYSAGEDRNIKAWDAAKLTESRSYQAQSDSIYAFAIQPNGPQLAIGRCDGVCIVLNRETGQFQTQLFPPKPLKFIAERHVPVAVMRGRTSRITVFGKHLDEVIKVSSSHNEITPRVISKKSKQIELEFTIPAQHSAGVVHLTLENPAGKSILSCAVDRYQAVSEDSDLTVSPTRSMPIIIPKSVAGTLDRAGDVDYYRFEATAGQQVGVQVVAAELGSKCDPTLVLTDLRGVVLAESSTGTLGYTITTRGTYAIGVRDREFRGGSDFHYRLHIGDIPVITTLFPLAVPRGRATTVHLDGVNLGRNGGFTSNVNPPKDAVLGSTFTVSVPVTPFGELPLGQATVVIDDYPAVVVDPNEGAELRVPGAADGILTKPDESQVVRFRATAGERVIVEVLARRARSPLDSVIDILDANGKPVPRATLRSTAKTFTASRDHDSKTPGIRLESWNELAINDYLYADGELMRILALPRNPDDDCQVYQVAGQRLGFLDTTPSHHSMGRALYRVEIHPPGTNFPPNGLPVVQVFYRNDDGGPGYGKDSRLIFDVPTDGIYQVRIRDARGQGGSSSAYHMTVRKPQLDFSVNITPASLNVWKGGAIAIGVSATRHDGFEGPIALELNGLPHGFHAPSTFIEANHTTTAFALSADADAVVPPNTRIKLKARAKIHGTEIVRELPIDSLKLLDNGDITSVTCENVIRIQPGKEATLQVDVVRHTDFKERIPLDVRGLPHGVRVLNVGLNGILLTERDTQRDIVLYAEPWVQPMEHPIVVVARSERKGTEHAARSVLLKVER